MWTRILIVSSEGGLYSKQNFERLRGNLIFVLFDFSASCEFVQLCTVMFLMTSPRGEELEEVVCGKDLTAAVVVSTKSSK